jgi:hypothetical protein
MLYDTGRGGEGKGKRRQIEARGKRGTGKLKASFLVHSTTPKPKGKRLQQAPNPKETDVPL